MLGNWPSCCGSTISHPFYHGEHGVRTLKELARSYLTITKDLARVMSRMKAIYRSWAIPCAGKPCIDRVIVQNGWRRSENREFAGEPSVSTNNWMRWNLCARKCDAIC